MFRSTDYDGERGRREKIAEARVRNREKRPNRLFLSLVTEDNSPRSPPA